MNKDFDFFLVLSALAVFLGLWLVVKSFKRTGNETSVKENISPKTPQRRTERVRARSTDTVTPQSEPAKPRVIRAMTFCFLTPDGLPFAVLTISSVGALAWGEAKNLGSVLNRFIHEFVKTQEGESVLLHVVRKADPALSLSVLAYDEKGSALASPMSSGLKVADFPEFTAFDNDEFTRWKREMLAAAYRKAFFQTQAHEMAYLIRSESKDKAIEDQNFLSANGRLALLYLGLIKINDEKSNIARLTLLNSYMNAALKLESKDLEEISRWQHLIFSQRFAQTQKLPFLLICTPSPSGKCYNALNY